MVDDRMLLATFAAIVSISVLTIFVGNSALAQSTTTDNSWLKGTIGVQTGKNTTETEQSGSLDVEGLSRQGADDLAIVCAFFPEQCSAISQTD
jgi:hypothetical protein